MEDHYTTAVVLLFSLSQNFAHADHVDRVRNRNFIYISNFLGISSSKYVEQKTKSAELYRLPSKTTLKYVETQMLAGWRIKENF